MNECGFDCPHQVSQNSVLNFSIKIDLDTLPSVISLSFDSYTSDRITQFTTDICLFIQQMFNEYLLRSMAQSLSTDSSVKYLAALYLVL